MSNDSTRDFAALTISLPCWAWDVIFQQMMHAPCAARVTPALVLPIVEEIRRQGAPQMVALGLMTPDGQAVTQPPPSAPAVMN